MIAREGYTIIAVVAGIGTLLVLIGMSLPSLWMWLTVALAVLLVIFTLSFFRDPNRTPPPEATEEQLILAPADGKVVEVIEHEHEPLYLKGSAKRVSIFLSLANVHVNRVPADGVIEYVRYVAGDYLVAWHPKASEKNERSVFGLRHANGCKVLFKQIAGKVARRIVYYLREGDEVAAGERFGIVKFGSRMDVFVPPGVPLDVSEGDRVRAGRTVLGRIPKQTSRVPGDADSSRKQPAAS